MKDEILTMGQISDHLQIPYATVKNFVWSKKVEAAGVVVGQGTRHIKTYSLELFIRLRDEFATLAREARIRNVMQSRKSIRPTCDIVKLDNSGIGLLTRAQIAQKLGITHRQFANYCTHMRLKPVKKLPGRGNTGLYFLPDVAKLIEERRKTTAEAKANACAHMRGCYLDLCRRREEDRRASIENSALALNDRIRALRESGMTAGRIAKLTHTSIVEVWAIIQQNEQRSDK